MFGGYGFGAAYGYIILTSIYMRRDMIQITYAIDDVVIIVGRQIMLRKWPFRSHDFLQHFLC